MFRPEILFDEARDHTEIPVGDINLAKRVSDVLAVHYPGHFFLVNADARTGFLTIQHPMVSERYGYRLRIDRMTGDDRRIVRAGGELLERWNVARQAYRYELIHEAQRAFA